MVTIAIRTEEVANDFVFGPIPQTCLEFNTWGGLAICRIPIDDTTLTKKGRGQTVDHMMDVILAYIALPCGV